jgi:hypothetical protein
MFLDPIFTLPLPSPCASLEIAKKADQYSYIVIALFKTSITYLQK